MSNVITTSIPKPAYICDPAKNTSCTKEGCTIFHFCRCTTNKEFAKTGENGKPIVAIGSDMEEEEMKKKVVFISLPMSGIPYDDVKANIEDAKAAYLAINKLDNFQVTFVHNHNCTMVGRSKMDKNHLAIWYLGEALKRLAECDEAFFWLGWEKARGCMMEHEVCAMYKIPCITVELSNKQ